MDSCYSEGTVLKARRKFQARRLMALKGWRDSLERRIAAIDASISTLENQINRDNELNIN
ncbi:hypothetical protein [Prochlorococcus sp. MIT 1341]|uniref:hypothetical protein n=1 Tax=Prochlorococcus sp. MIT 1341 TaxID=3096221 RepID=UPI002A753978|nr:hypothetical protein [Prochlorococcus sp. MIT 1341]